MLARAYISNALSTIVKIISGIFLLRYFSGILGKNGFGLASQFQSLALLIYAFFYAFFFNHIVKDKNIAISNYVFRKILGIVLIVAIFVSILLFMLSHFISMLLFENLESVKAIYILALLSPFTAYYVALSAKFCAEEKLLSYNIFNASGLVVSTLCIFLLTKIYGLIGAYIGFALYFLFPMLFLCVNAFLTYSNFRLLIPSFKDLNKYADWRLIKIASFGIFSAINAISLQLFLRRYLASTENWSTVGDWQAITKVSESYLLLVTIPLTTFLLPKIVNSKNIFHQKKLIRDSILIGLIITFIVGSIIFLFWNGVIVKIIGESFSDLHTLWLIQIGGDLFKVVTWTLGILAIAKMELKIALISELIYSSIYIFLVVFLTPIYHIQGPFIAYTIGYLITCSYFLFHYEFLVMHD